MTESLTIGETGRTYMSIQNSTCFMCFGLITCPFVVENTGHGFVVSLTCFICILITLGGGVDYVFGHVPF